MRVYNAQNALTDVEADSLRIFIFDLCGRFACTQGVIRTFTPLTQSIDPITK
jgi:hypothetical protein